MALGSTSIGWRSTVYYTVTTSTSTPTVVTTTNDNLRGPGAPCANGAANCFVGTIAGGGQVLNTRGFWGTMNTQGAENANGDAFQPYYDAADLASGPQLPRVGKGLLRPG